MAIREIEVEGAKHQGLQFKDHVYAHELLDGLHGIELGPSSHNSFHLPGSIAIAPKDNFEFYKTAGQTQWNGKYCEVDVWGEADATTLPDNSQDYVISSHVVEHIPDLIRAFQEWDRILVYGGYVFMIIPQRDALDSDKGRELSTLTDVLTAYESEWTPNTVPEAVDKLAGGWRGHYWVFTSKSFEDIIIGLIERGYIRWEIIHEEDPDTKVGNGFCVVYKIHKPVPPIQPEVKVENETVPDLFSVLEQAGLTDGPLETNLTSSTEPKAARKPRKKNTPVLE